jgi:hypothetical protein
VHKRCSSESPKTAVALDWYFLKELFADSYNFFVIGIEQFHFALLIATTLYYFYDLMKKILCSMCWSEHMGGGGFVRYDDECERNFDQIDLL